MIEVVIVQIYLLLPLPEYGSFRVPIFVVFFACVLSAELISLILILVSVDIVTRITIPYWLWARDRFPVTVFHLSNAFDANMFIQYKLASYKN